MYLRLALAIIFNLAFVLLDFLSAHAQGGD
jgi:hypothetical protein